MPKGERRWARDTVDTKMTAQHYNILPASEADYKRCNACGYPFARRGVSVDMNDFRAHKATCVPDFDKE